MVWVLLAAVVLLDMTIRLWYVGDLTEQGGVK